MVAFTKQELGLLLAEAQRRDARNTQLNRPTHYWLMILTAFRHGLRNTEVRTMTGSQVQDGYLIVQRLKNSLKTRQRILSEPDPLFSLRDALEKRATEVGPHGLLFPMSRDGFLKMVHRLGGAAGLPEHKCHPHTMKHTIAMEIKRKKLGFEVIRQHLGHKNGGSSLEYMKLSDDEATDELAAALGAY